jgi:CRISPR-associated endonuclease Csy4
MKHYIELILLPDLETPLFFLWEKVYQQLHLSLVEKQTNDGNVSVGVAFPEYNIEKRQLGSKLRLISSSKKELENLNINQWLSRLNDYLHITAIREIPEKIESYVFFNRIQPKNNNARLARRMVKRKGISYEKALLHYQSREESMSRLPFIKMESQSTNNKFQLFIEKSESDKKVTGSFNSYGLSKATTVPWF